MQLASQPLHPEFISPSKSCAKCGQILDKLPEIFLMGIKLAAFSEQKCIETILDLIAHGRGGNVLTMNLDHARRYLNHGACREEYDAATIRVADGMPLVWASHIIGPPLPERVTGSNLIFSLTAAAAEQGHSVYLLGGNPGTAEATAEKLRQASPMLNIAGIDCPEFGFDDDRILVDQVVDRVIASGAKIIYVALGYPREEMVIKLLKQRCPAAWIIGVGISFSFVSGDLKRAPTWMQLLGLEWLFRLLQEPGRLYQRYLLQGVPFFFKFIFLAFKQRFTLR